MMYARGPDAHAYCPACGEALADDTCCGGQSCAHPSHEVTGFCNVEDEGEDWPYEGRVCTGCASTWRDEAKAAGPDREAEIARERARGIWPT